MAPPAAAGDARNAARHPRRATADFGSPPTLSRVHWVRPELVAEVKFLTWTEDNLLRQLSVSRRRSPTPRGPRPSALRAEWRCRLALQTRTAFASQSRCREYGSVYELTHRAPGSRRSAGSRSTRTECPESVGRLSVS